jgi:periplasmic copper chaperone A
VPPRALTTLTILALAVVGLAGCGGSGDPDLRIVGDPQAAVPVSGSSQVVVTIANDGDGDDELIEATTEAALGVEIHLTEIDEGRATMRQLESVEVPAGEQVRFRPGGLHLMLVVPDATVVEGGTFTLTLHFDRSDDLTVDVEVVPLLDLAEDADIDQDDDA